MIKARHRIGVDGLLDEFFGLSRGCRWCLPHNIEFDGRLPVKLRLVEHHFYRHG